MTGAMDTATDCEANGSSTVASVIAIDGPVASGKTTVGRAVAARLSYRFLDTGLMYRAVAWLALRQGISVEDAKALGRLAEELDFQVTSPDDRGRQRVLVAGSDVLAQLLSPGVEALVSQVAAVGEVRQALVTKQRDMAREGCIVMVGRDIGTNVLPDAPLKVYLDASLHERARRRYHERLARGEVADLDEEVRQLGQRDRLDQGRAVNPLRQAGDACAVVTDGMSVQDVTARLLELAQVGATECRDTTG